MTCFWDGLYASLTDIEKIPINKVNGDSPAKKMCKYLKIHNVPVVNIKVNSHQITAKQALENYDHVEMYSSRDISLGKFVSTFDPFVMIFCELFSVRVVHMYNECQVEYSLGYSQNSTVYFASNPSHFWFVKREFIEPKVQ